MSDVVFVGAGPIGLYTAIQLKLYCPEVDICMYEKYEEYQRKHVLIIEPSSYNGAHQDERLQAILNELEGKVPTSLIETKLLKFARELGINIQYEKIESLEMLASHHPEAKIFVGSDGSHSLTREEVFNGEREVQEDLQYIVEMKYYVQGASRALEFFGEYPAFLSLGDHLATEFIGKEKEGQTPISLRFFVNKETFDEMQLLGVSFKNPLNLIKAKAIHSKNIALVVSSIDKWTAGRAALINEELVEGSDKITMVNLPIYRSKHFHKKAHDKEWYLVGDAAMGVPYFRALNAGLISANKLSKVLHCSLGQAQILESRVEEPTFSSFGSFSKISSSMKTLEPAEDYTYFMSRLANSEISSARIKALGVQIAETSLSSSRAIPVSAMKLPVEARRQIKLAGREKDESCASTGSLCSIM